MSRAVKLVLYVLCVLGVIIFGTLTLRAYRQASAASEQRKERINQLTGTETTNAPAAPTTNAPQPGLDPVTNSTPLDPTQTTPPAPTSEETNALAAAAGTNAPPSTNPAPVAAGKNKESGSDPEIASGGAASGYTRMVTYGLGLFISFIGLGILVGYDVSQFIGHRAQAAMFNDDGQPANPEYEQAEKLWANGQYLDAVRAMREYLEKNPREQYVALRIAEIYEENLNNPLAAALEYEEVLKKKLPPERWGWAAIHLANLYSGKLDKPDKAVELLHRIDAEYGQTGAAKKARERLLQIDPTFVSASAAMPVEPEPEPSIDEQPVTPKPASNLPPGFRPKK